MSFIIQGVLMKFFTSYISILTLFILVSCAGKKTKEIVETQVKQETVVKKEDLKQNTLEYIDNNQNLSEAQKKQLKSLHENSSKEMMALNEEINKTKMVLVKTLLEPKMSRKKVAVLRRDLKKLERKRMNTSLSSFDKAQNIINPITDLETRKHLYNSFLMRERRYENF